MMRVERLLQVVPVSLSLAACAAVQQPAAPAADWVLTNGRIYTVDEAQPWAEAVAIRNGKIVHVGDNASASKFEAAQTTDLGGRMVMPGIVDGHTHPGLIGIEQYQIDSEATEHEA